MFTSKVSFIEYAFRCSTKMVKFTLTTHLLGGVARV
jgi:hypothetical protein